MILDSTDVTMLEILQDNARISMSEISKKVNLSLSAVSERLRKLEACGIIDQYTTIINPTAMGQGLSVIMMISLISQNNNEDFFAFVSSRDEILECNYITGEYDYLLRITTSNTESLEKLMNAIKSMPCINRTQTIVLLNSIKKKYSVLPTAIK